MTTEDEQDNQCPACGSKRLFTDYMRAEVVCDDCGTVVADRVIKEGPPPSEDHQPGSDNRILPQLYFPGRDSEGRPVDPETVRKFRITARMQNLKSSERAILIFEGRLRELAHRHSIADSVTKRAIDMYHRVRSKKVFSKPNITELALALLLTASREMKYVITLKDLIDGTQASMNKVKKYHYGIARALGVEYSERSVQNFIMYFAAKIGKMGDGLVLSVATKIASGITDPNAAPHCVAAAALYSALLEVGEEWSQHEFCEKVKLSEISLREWVNRLGGQRVRLAEPSQRPDPAALRES